MRTGIDRHARRAESRGVAVEKPGAGQRRIGILHEDPCPGGCHRRRPDRLLDSLSSRQAWLADVVLLERDELTSGSTWHAAANIHGLHDSTNISRLQHYTMALYKELETETGQGCGIFQPGSLYLAQTEAREHQLRLQEAKARRYKMNFYEVDRDEAERLHPLVDFDGIRCIMYEPRGRQCRPLRRDCGLCRRGAPAGCRDPPLHPGDRHRAAARRLAGSCARRQGDMRAAMGRQCRRVCGRARSRSHGRHRRCR